MVSIATIETPTIKSTDAVVVITNHKKLVLIINFSYSCILMHLAFLFLDRYLCTYVTYTINYLMLLLNNDRESHTKRNNYSTNHNVLVQVKRFTNVNIRYSHWGYKKKMKNTLMDKYRVQNGSRRDLRICVDLHIF